MFHKKQPHPARKKQRIFEAAFIVIRVNMPSAVYTTTIHGVGVVKHRGSFRQTDVVRGIHEFPLQFCIKRLEP